MNPENQGGYPDPNQNPNQMPVGSPQPPQVYGPQQYSPMAAFDPTKPLPQQPKSNKKLLIGVAVLGALLLVIILVAVLMSLGGGKNGELTTNQDITQTYDSPVGLTPGLQAGAVRSGKFKLTTSYVTGGDFTRSGTFAVEDGRVYFDMVTDDTRVNELMRSLYTRTGSTVPFSAERHGVNRTLTYDFASMLGYHYLYDENGGELSGFVPRVEAAKSATTPDPRFTLTSGCDSALKDVKSRTGMNTTGLTFDLGHEGINKRTATVSFATLQAIDKAVIGFFERCYDLGQPAQATLKKFVDDRKENVTKSPTFTFWQENGINILEISAPPKDTPFGGGFRFELTGLSTSQTQHTGTVGSYVERRNQFGLTYSLCRVDPVVTTSQAAGYTFLQEDPAYRYPNVLDTGYYCTTLAVPAPFKPAASLVLKSTTGKDTTIAAAAIDGLRGLHDLVYQVERYNVSNERYPGPTEFRDLANSNMGSLTSVTQTTFANKTLVYTPSPVECVGTCKDFALSFVPAPTVQVQRTTYKP